MIDIEGRVVGGLDPLPCELVPTSDTAVLAGDIAAIAGREHIYLLDLGAF